MTVYLNEIMKAQNDPLSKGFIANLLRYSDLMKIVPIDDVAATQVTGSRWQTLPDVGFRKYGGGYTASEGTTEPVSETLALLGGDIKIDKVKGKNLKEDPLVTQTKMKAQAVAFAFNYYLVNGDLAVDADGWDGLKKRVANMASRQTIYLDSNGDGTGDSLKVLASSENRQTFLDALHEAKKKAGATHFLGNEDSYLGLGKILRREGLLETTTDAYGYEWDAFAKTPLVDVGLKADKATEIITNTEDPGDGGNDSSSIYAVRFDTDEGVHVIQLEGSSPEVYDPLNGAEMESGPQYLRRVDWPVGMFNLSTYCIVRIRGFKMSAN